MTTDPTGHAPTRIDEKMGREEVDGRGPGTRGRPSTRVTRVTGIEVGQGTPHPSRTSESTADARSSRLEDTTIGG